MRILIVGNAASAPTGYGTQIKGMIGVFKALGHEVAVANFYGVQGASLTIEGVPHYVPYRDMWQQDVLRLHVEHFGAACVLTLHDNWVLSDGLQDKAGVPWVQYFPVDSVPAAPRTVQVAKQARFPVVYSQFGLDEMTKAGVKCDYVAHGIDCETFSPGDKAEARKVLGLPADAYLVSCVGANKGFPSRKSFPEQLTAFAQFAKEHPDAHLFLHTQKSPVGGYSDGIYFDPLISDLGLNGRVTVSNEYLASQGFIEPKDLAQMYRASDVVMHASMAEGFGLCAAEAMACGTPTILQNFSAMPEMAFDQELLVEPLGRYWSLLGTWQSLTSPDNVLAALDFAYEHREELLARTDDRTTFIRSRYSWPIVQPQWDVLLRRVETEITETRCFAAAD